MYNGNKFEGQIVLDYILSHVGPGECPYLKVEILGQQFFGLLDSGANKIFVGSKGWEKLKCLGVVLDKNRRTTCTVASDDTCVCIGIISVPFQLRGIVKLFNAYVVPTLRHELILGIEFWKNMGIVPDLRRGEWFFSSEILETPEINQIQCEADLSPEQQDKLSKVVSRYFEKIGDKLGCTSAVTHKIVTNSPPIKQRYYPVSPFKQKLIDAELDKMLKAGIVEPSKSAWSSPVLLVPKSNGEQRFCVDFRKLNSVTEKDAYPLPYISSILDKLGGARFLSSLDLKSAYWQVALDESSKQYTAFTVPNKGLFQFTRLPFGLHNAPATFQRLIDTVLGPELDKYVFCYLDDVIVVTSDFDTHIKILQEVFKRLESVGLTLNREKSKFCRSQLRYLGYLVNKHGISVDPSKVEAITNLATPKNVSDVRRIIGMISYYRRFVPSFSDMIAPLTRLLRKGVKFLWDNDCEQSFKTIKNSLVTAPILTCPNFEHSFILQTDASSFGIGAVLTQYYDGREHVICYVSRTLSRTERVYSATERELLALIWSAERLRCYLEGAKFQVITDHYSLKWLDNLKNPQGRLGRWTLRLQQFDFEVIHRKGREHIVPDALSRAVPEDPNTVVESNELSNVEIKDVKDIWYLKMCEKIESEPLSFPQWRVTNGNLYKYVKLDFPGLREDEDFWKLVVPKEKRRDIISSYHDTTIGGHLGVHKTFHKVSRLYYWPCLKADIAKFVKCCLVCQQVKSEQKAPSGLMGGPIIAKNCWEIISMDIFGPLPKSKSGNMYIFVVTDTFSKFNLFFPIRRANASTLSKIIEEKVFLLYGVPQLIRCDNGVQFKSKEFSNLTNKYGVRILFNPNYHPSPNLTERVNRILKAMLSAFVGDQQRDWDIHLAAMACAINTAKHSTTGQTPYFTNFGSEMKLHGNDYSSRVNNDPNKGEPDETKSRRKADILCKLREIVIKKMEKTHGKAKNQYDLRRRNINFIEGDLVWKRKFSQSDGGNYFTAKLAGKFDGPFRIRKKCGYCVYELEELNGKSKGRWHVQDLKPYHDSAD